MDDATCGEHPEPAGIETRAPIFPTPVIPVGVCPSTRAESVLPTVAAVHSHSVALTADFPHTPHGQKKARRTQHRRRMERGYDWQACNTRVRECRHRSGPSAALTRCTGDGAHRSQADRL